MKIRSMLELCSEIKGVRMVGTFLSSIFLKKEYDIDLPSELSATPDRTM